MKQSKLLTIPRAAARMLLATLLLAMTAQTAWADTAVSLQQDGSEYYVNMLSSGTSILTLNDASVTTFKVYDDGGKDNHYAYTGNSTLKITVPVGYVINITGNSRSEDPFYDYWKIWDGHVYSDGTLIQFSTAISKTINVQTTGNKAAIWFHKGKSSYADNTRFLGLTVTLIDATKDIAQATVTGIESLYSYTGSVISLNYSVTAYMGSTPLTKGTHFTETITKGGVVVTEVKETGDYTLTLTGQSPYFGTKTVNFTVSEGTASLQQDGDEWYVLMPKGANVGENTTVAITNTLDIRDKTAGFTFNIYDDGGKGDWGKGDFWGDVSSYSNPATRWAKGYLKIKIPDNCFILLTGKVMTQRDEQYLTIYDGDNTTSKTLCANIHGTTYPTISRNNAIVDIGTLTSIGNTILVYFDNGFFWDCPGLSLTATLIGKDSPQNINFGSYSNGTVTSIVEGNVVTGAAPFKNVTLSISPDDGYIINYITVKDNYNHTVTLTGGTWYDSSTSATFTMPGTAVTVTPVFIEENNMTASNGLKFETTSNIRQNITLTENIRSLNISASSEINLAVSDGTEYNLLFEGHTHQRFGDWCGIYDGTTVDANKLFYNSSAPNHDISVKSTSKSMLFNSREQQPQSYINGILARIYGISYDLSGGSLETDNPTEYTCETIDFTLANPTKATAGYEFAGWTGTGLDAASTAVTIAKGSYGNREYTATWTPIEYTITYDLDGGTVATENPTTYTVESADVTLVNPTRDGYTFAGWTGTDLTDATNAVTIAAGSTGNREYTATWTAIEYTITYDLDGGTVATPNPTSYTIEDAVTLNNPTKDGYTFAGWTGTDLADATNAVTIAAGSTGNRTFTATWTPAANIALAARQAPDGNYWTTFYCGKAGYTIDAEENACAYTATYADGKLTLHNQGKTIAKGEAVIIVADNNEVSMTKGDDGTPSDENDLHGVDVDTPTANIQVSLGTGKFYVLGMTTVDTENRFGFHPYDGAEMAARKAFVLLNGEAALARSLTMVFDTVTGISNMNVTDSDDVWYSLDGRKLQSKPTASGVYVNNGRKIVIK